MNEYKPLFDAIEDLKERAREGWVIIVEGVRDAESLRNLGVRGEIIVFSGFAATADIVKDRDSIIMTDYDSRGMEIERGLIRALQSYGKVPDTGIKRRIFSNVKKEISKVEELHSFISKIRVSKNSK
ncbi:MULTISPECIES: toprim domain-containing protein [unclassified Archaeoglobus]|jgi:2,5-diamino-6-(ribosylamino)-4(3H)-pyrimidinone 5'-phosphate reductase|uniref:toprim domain-containing protein n=1 Tax=unclassified Archaeoglobus TaxID=2643606 RepID=UPI0025BD2886|nr:MULTISPECIES: toprim domain-containing protein [unclassified Archaeoglobus]